MGQDNHGDTEHRRVDDIPLLVVQAGDYQREYQHHDGVVGQGGVLQAGLEHQNGQQRKPELSCRNLQNVIKQGGKEEIKDGYGHSQVQRQRRDLENAKNIQKSHQQHEAYHQPTDESNAPVRLLSVFMKNLIRIVHRFHPLIYVAVGYSFYPTVYHNLRQKKTRDRDRLSCFSQGSR